MLNELDVDGAAQALQFYCNVSRGCCPQRRAPTAFPVARAATAIDPEARGHWQRVADARLSRVACLRAGVSSARTSRMPPSPLSRRVGSWSCVARRISPLCPLAHIQVAVAPLARWMRDIRALDDQGRRHR